MFTPEQQKKLIEFRDLVRKELVKSAKGKPNNEANIARMEELKRNARSTPGCSARVLVHKNQSCCLIGVGGAVIKEMVKSTGAGIEILDETDVPACASHCERVLQASIFLQRKGIIKT